MVPRGLEHDFETFCSKASAASNNDKSNNDNYVNNNDDHDHNDNNNNMFEIERRAARARLLGLRCLLSRRRKVWYTRQGVVYCISYVCIYIYIMCIYIYIYIYDYIETTNNNYKL